MLKRRLNSCLRYMMVRLLSDRIPLYVINEYPRSGGTWIGEMIGKALDVPFPSLDTMICKPALIHGHYLSGRGMKNVVVVWRDGRDVMVSWYYYCLFYNDEGGNHRIVSRTRRDLPFRCYEDIWANMPVFIDYCFTRQSFPRFSWSDFVSTWHECNNVVYARYEDFSRDAAQELRRVVSELCGQELSHNTAASIADEFSFFRQSGRHRGEEKKESFRRKGITGDWQRYFTEEARLTFDLYAGNELIMLGYEKDRNWTASWRTNIPKI